MVAGQPASREEAMARTRNHPDFTTYTGTSTVSLSDACLNAVENARRGRSARRGSVFSVEVIHQEIVVASDPVYNVIVRIPQF
jgi:hypothetical protein